MPKSITIFTVSVFLLVASEFYSKFTRSTNENLISHEMVVSSEPGQKLLSAPGLAEPITLEHLHIRWHMLPQAEYRIAARVLQSTPYDDWQAAFTPIDLALGWGEIGQSRVDKYIDWWQADRWYYYRLRPRVGKMPFSQDYVIQHSANVHVVPANANIAAGLQLLKTNDLIFMEGMLVDVEVTDGHTFRKYSTSLVRDDVGDASCEIMYVEHLVINGVEYR